MSDDTTKKVLVTGATGYIGGRLIPRLLDQGHDVHVFVRDPARVAGRPWLERVTVHVGDIVSGKGLNEALQGMHAAYYLVHSMYGGKDYAKRDRQAAENLVQAGRDLQHVIYLGGLMPREGKASLHLSSRAEVGKILRDGLPTTEFRAGPIIGSGSASFEMVRYLTERLPVMIAPRWVNNEVQPIAIRDTLEYLLQALELAPQGVIEIGASPHTFREMMTIYADIRGYKRRIFSVPVLAPALAARWVGLVTPIPNTLAVPLVQGVVQPLLADTSKATDVFPNISPLNYREAVSLALGKTQQGDVETRWSGALGKDRTYDVTDWEGMIREVRTAHVELPHESLFQSFASVGGEQGWGRWDWAWELRGFIDRIMGGPGLRRGRRNASELLPGEALDFWRVEAIERPNLLRLRAEMKVPGRAWLQWEMQPEDEGTRLIQTALFEPKGPLGALYWYTLYPFHRFIFGDLLRWIVDRAKTSAKGAT